MKGQRRKAIRADESKILYPQPAIDEEPLAKEGARVGMLILDLADQLIQTPRAEDVEGLAGAGELAINSRWR